MPTTIQTVRGEHILSWIDSLARLRIEVFREFPYLYDGDNDYERAYVSTYAKCTDSVFVLARDGDEVIGVSTAVPLIAESPSIQQPFIKANIPVNSVFYFGESVLKKSYRGQGLGKAFMRERETAAKQHHGIQWAAFCAVIRPDNHPKRPPDHRPLDPFWKNCGFLPQPEMQTLFHWKELSEPTESPKPMQFWLKPLS